LTEKFKVLISAGVVKSEIGWGTSHVLKDFKGMKIDNLRKLDNIIPKDFPEKAKYYYLKSMKRVGEGKFLLYPVLIDIFIINNAELYFQKIWKNSWGGIDNDSVELIQSYGVDFEKYRKLNGLTVY
jgi:hypothetical protein